MDNQEPAIKVKRRGWFGTTHIYCMKDVYRVTVYGRHPLNLAVYLTATPNCAIHFLGEEAERIKKWLEDEGLGPWD